MGGAACFCTYQRNPSLFSGVVFVSPMCKISQEMLPPQWVIDLLYKILGPKGTYSVFGCLPIAPSKGDLRQYSFRLAYKGDRLFRSPTSFVRNPRLATARELLVCVSVTATTGVKCHTFPFNLHASPCDAFPVLVGCNDSHIRES